MTWTHPCNTGPRKDRPVVKRETLTAAVARKIVTYKNDPDTHPEPDNELSTEIWTQTYSIEGLVLLLHARNNA